MQGCWGTTDYLAIVRTLKLKKGLFFEFNAPTIRKDEFSILCKCNISTLTLGMMWFRKVDLDAEIKGDNLVPQKCLKLLDHLSRCVYVLLIGFFSK